MSVDLSELDFTFGRKPLVIGGEAMAFYGIRPAGDDVDLVAAPEDHARLVARYPEQLNDLVGDIGVLVGRFEIWNTICRFDYDHLREQATERHDHLVVSVEKLLFLKALAMKNSEKNRRDVDLIVAHVLAQAYRA